MHRYFISGHGFQFEVKITQHRLNALQKTQTSILRREHVQVEITDILKKSSTVNIIIIDACEAKALVENFNIFYKCLPEGTIIAFSTSLKVQKMKYGSRHNYYTKIILLKYIGKRTYQQKNYLKSKKNSIQFISGTQLAGNIHAYDDFYFSKVKWYILRYTI